MRKNVKSILCLLLAMVFVIGMVAACGNGDAEEAPPPTVENGGEEVETPPPADPEPDTGDDDVNVADDDEVITVRIGWSPPDVTGVFATVTDFMEAAIATSAPYNINIEFVERPPQDHTGVAEQIAVIETFIVQGVDVIMVAPTDVDGIIPALREVNEAGIPLIMVNMMSEIPGVEVTSFVGFDNRIAAEVTGWSMINALGGPGPLPQAEEPLAVPVETHLDVHWWRALYEGFDRESISGNVAIIEGIHGDYFSNARNAGFMDVIEQFPNIEVLTILPGDWNRAVSVEQAENILQMFGPGEIDAIFAPSSEMGFGARIAVENAGREDDVLVLTHGGTVESGDWIRDGRLLVDTWHGFPDWGWYSVMFAAMATLGQDIPHMHDIGARTQWIENADMFFPNVQLAPIPWQEIIDNRN